MIEFQSRAYLYNFDFLRFRGCAEESMRVVNTFICQGICWKFRFGGEFSVSVNGKLIIPCVAVDRIADAYTLPLPFKINIGDDVCIVVADTECRWFRWFRRNTARVTLEGLEAEP